MRNAGSYTFWVLLLGLLLAGSSILSLVQNLLALGISDTLTVAINYYRGIRTILFGWLPAPLGYKVPDWYLDAWLGAALLLNSFVRAFRHQGGKIAFADFPLLIIGSMTLIGYILASGGIARFLAHVIRGNREGIDEEKSVRYVYRYTIYCNHCILYYECGLETGRPIMATSGPRTGEVSMKRGLQTWFSAVPAGLTIAAPFHCSRDPRLPKTF
jgi:hypothetical protein